jgi:hypothetical protein
MIEKMELLTLEELGKKRKEKKDTEKKSKRRIRKQGWPS